MPSLRRLLGDAQRVVEEGLHQRPQQQFLVRAMFETLDAGEVEVRFVDVVFQHAADLVRVRAGGADDGSGVAVQQVGTQQHQIAKLQQPGQSVIRQQRHRGAHVGLAESFRGQHLLQPLSQLSEPQQADIPVSYTVLPQQYYCVRCRTNRYISVAELQSAMSVLPGWSSSRTALAFSIAFAVRLEIRA